MRSARQCRGTALVEFALLSLTVYLLVAGGIELGRMIFVSQVLQDAARVAARELALAELHSDLTFEAALPAVFDPDLLVVDLDAIQEACAAPQAQCLDSYFNELPVVNRALRPLFISDTEIDDGTSSRRLLRYPGALLKKTPSPGPFTGGYVVRVPRVTARGEGGVETVEWIPIVAEVRSNPVDPACAPYGPFPLSLHTIDLPQCAPESSPKGFAAVTIHYPFQSAALSGFQKGGGTVDPNAGNVIVAADGSVTATDPGNQLAGTASSGSAAGAIGPYSGDYGLGAQYAFAKTVRPYRSLLSAQALFRREVVQ